MRTPLIIAHRGASRLAPENTMSAFRRAIADGADGAEFDVRLAADGVPVVIHDADLKRTGGMATVVSETSSSELANCDVGKWFYHKFDQPPPSTIDGVPTLADVLELYRDQTGPIFIELKCDTPAVADLVDSVCREVASRPEIGHRVIIKSFRLAAIAAAKQCLPTVATAALFEPSIMTFLRRRRNIVDMAMEFGADRVSLHYTLASARLTEYAHRAGLPITIWTVDNRRWLARCRERGIDTLITNDPRSMI